MTSSLKSLTILCVGAGFSGAVIAREFAQQGCKVHVVDERPHLAGNCHTERDERSGVMVHKYGPHIFHTSSEEIWAYVNRFANFMPFTNRVKATSQGQVYSLPINLHTINQLFGKTMGPAEAEAFLKEECAAEIENPRSFEEQALAFVGRKIYDAFFKGYTRKQWGVEPTELPASILKRLPLRFTYDDNYFNDRYQGIPQNGYSDMVAAILDHPNIEVSLSTRFEDLGGTYDHIFYSGPIDRYFGYKLGDLRYRTLDFEEVRDTGDLLGTAVMNYCDEEVPWTRISDHKYFAPWEMDQTKGTVAFKEFSRQCGRNDIPYYPMRLLGDKELLEKYVELVQAEKNITFVGRLGTYRYIDMDKTIGEALETSRQAITSLSRGEPPKKLYQEVL